MAAFASQAAAEKFARDKMADKTYIAAHACLNEHGTIGCRVLKKATGTVTGGGWTILTDDA